MEDLTQCASLFLLRNTDPVEIDNQSGIAVPFDVMANVFGIWSVNVTKWVTLRSISKLRECICVAIVVLEN